jgi:hypothetical protein
MGGGIVKTKSMRGRIVKPKSMVFSFCH